ncbi:reverse transcriptase [Fusarium oxysporum f. sp. phaseoli]
MCNLLFFLGGKTAVDEYRWSPNLGEVQVAIKFAISIGRLDTIQI